VHKVGLCFAALMALSMPVWAATKNEPAPSEEMPRLVLQITVDQLRGDLPLRYQDRFGKGGFRYFLKQGTWYADANYTHSHTETIVGHGTLATGAQPSRHGLIGDKAFARQTADDPEEGICSPPPPDSTTTSDSGDSGSAQSNEYTPVPGGATPESILTTTFSDELMLQTAGRSKVFGVSWKDRAAVPMAGHAGKAFWFSTSNGCFSSSTYYYTTYPDWLTAWCGKHVADQYKDVPWNLLHDKSTYVFRDLNNQFAASSPPEKNMQMLDGPLQFGRTFPHKISTAASYYDALSISPFADELTAAFAEELVRQEKLGKDDIPDYLAISFSATDLGGHWFGPSSLESEDGLLRLDRTLEQLLTFIDKEVGLKNTLIVLAGDHGIPDYPEYLQTLKVSSGRIATQTILDAANAALQAAYGNVDGIIGQYSHPWIYLCHDAIGQKKLDSVEVERVIARAVSKLDGIALAVPNSDPHAVGLDNDAYTVMQVRNSYNPRRSGNVYVVQRPQWQVDDSNAQGPMFLSHGSPWTYDTYVPVAFAGARVPAGMVYRGISPLDVAATLSAYLRTKFPSGSTGEPLMEVLTKK
jgi:hypothetical protein